MVGEVDGLTGTSYTGRSAPVQSGPAERLRRQVRRAGRSQGTADRRHAVRYAKVRAQRGVVLVDLAQQRVDLGLGGRSGGREALESGSRSSSRKTPRAREKNKKKSSRAPEAAVKQGATTARGPTGLVGAGGDSSTASRSGTRGQRKGASSWDFDEPRPLRQRDNA